MSQGVIFRSTWATRALYGARDLGEWSLGQLELPETACGLGLMAEPLKEYIGEVADCSSPEQGRKAWQAAHRTSEAYPHLSGGGARRETCGFETNHRRSASGAVTG